MTVLFYFPEFGTLNSFHVGGAVLWPREGNTVLYSDLFSIFYLFLVISCFIFLGALEEVIVRGVVLRPGGGKAVLYSKLLFV